MENTKKCPECDGVLEVGFVADYAYGGAGKSKWTTKISGVGLFTKLENSKEITTYRCNKCGLLKSYAK